MSEFPILAYSFTLVQSVRFRLKSQRRVFCLDYHDVQVDWCFEGKGKPEAKNLSTWNSIENLAKQVSFRHPQPKSCVGIHVCRKQSQSLSIISIASLIWLDLTWLYYLHVLYCIYNLKHNYAICNAHSYAAMKQHQHHRQQDKAQYRHLRKHPYTNTVTSVCQEQDDVKTHFVI